MSALRIIGLCFCGAGVLTAVAGIWILKTRIGKVRTWRPVEARVLTSIVTSEEGTETTDYYAKYEVRYEVDGAVHTGKLRSWSSSSGGAQQRVARHPVGSTGTIYYNPADAKQVDGNLGMNPATLSLPVSVLGAGVAVIVFGLMFVLLGGGPR
jgi:hypothetical protein